MVSLNDRQRMALLLSKFEGMSYEEIAQSMELSVSAIKSLLSRARVNLKDILAPYIQEGILREWVGETLNSTEDEEGGES